MAGRGRPHQGELVSKLLVVHRLEASLVQSTKRAGHRDVVNDFLSEDQQKSFETIYSNTDYF